MALTKAQFRDAISHLTSTGTLSGLGALFIDINNLRVLDEGNANADITPNQSTLDQALIDLATQQSTEQQQETIKNNAKAQAAAIPSWSSWTEAETLDYIDTNVIDLASAKVVIRAMARMVIALRNEQWPDLEGSV